MFSSYAHSDDKKYFVCDILDDLEKDVDLSRSFDGELNYFDSVFHYEKTDDGYSTGFGRELKLKGDVLYRADLSESGERTGFYREFFTVFRMDIEKQVLIKSYVYYVHPDDSMNSPEFLQYNQPFLFDFMDREAPENYVKIGWDKTKWQCYEISRFKYFMFHLKMILFFFTA